MSILIALIILALVFFAFLFVIFNMAFAVPKKGSDVSRQVPNTEQYLPIKEKMLSLVDELCAIESEPVYTTSFDGLKLYGRYYKQNTPDIIEIEFHGYRSSAYRDYCGGSSINRQNKVSTILVDQRGHGKSQGRAITFGIKERYDVLSWVNYVNERFGKQTKIVLSGVSMGAATVLMASELDLPENVVAILADCPYSSPKDIILKVCRDRGLNPKLMYPFIYLTARLFARIDLNASSAVKAVQKTNIPVLIIHGDDDRYVPYEMGVEIYNACKSKKKMLTVKGAGHGICYFVDNKAYIDTVNEFINEII